MTESSSEHGVEAAPPGRPLTPAEQLALLEGSHAKLAAVRTQAHRHLAWFATALGLLIGAAHVVPSVFRPDESLPAFLTAMGVYVVAVLVVTVWYLRTRTATTLGGGRRYLLGLAITMVLYAGALTLLGRETWPVALVVGLVIAAPLVIAG